MSDRSEQRALEELASDAGAARPPWETGERETSSLGIQGRGGVTILCRRVLPLPSPVFDTFWRFAAERQEVFYKKLVGAWPPWTHDAILQTYKFTNAYRSSDRTSQYLIRHVIYEGEQTPREIFFRTVLFKLFNKIETWELLKSRIGLPLATEYKVERYDEALADALEQGIRIYSGAYIMPSALGFGGQRKHGNHLRLLEKMLRDDVPERVADTREMRAVFSLLRSYHSVGDFLAYQIAIDLNYGALTNFSEMDFVMPGPGARDGIRKCFVSLGDCSEADVIRLVTETQADQFADRDLKFRSLWGRPLQLVDCQNLFCEVDKYARLAHPEVRGRTERKRIKQRYRARPGQTSVWYPPKWGLNAAIKASSSGSHGAHFD